MGVTLSDVILIYLPLFHAFGFSRGAMSPITGRAPGADGDLRPGRGLG